MYVFVALSRTPAEVLFTILLCGLWIFTYNQRLFVPFHIQDSGPRSAYCRVSQSSGKDRASIGVFY